MSKSVFAPAHITGFFTVEKNINPLMSGSCGAGFLLDKGVKTTVKNSYSSDFKVNWGSDIVISEVLKHFDTDMDFKIIQDIQLPIGAGFGTSAASALSLSLALNEFLDCGFSFEKCAGIAHVVDVSLGGGLGDVIAQCGHGLVLRTKPGALGTGEIESFYHDLFVGCKTFGAIDTSLIIGDSNYQRIISASGSRCLDDFRLNLSVTNFLRLAYDFSSEINLMTGEVKSLIDYINSEDNILGASMAMLGNTVFAFSYDETSLKNLGIENFNIYQLNNDGVIYD